VLDKDGTQTRDRMDRLEARIEELIGGATSKIEERIKPIESFREEQLEMAQRAQDARMVNDFVEYVGRNPEKFRFAAGLEAEQLAADLKPAWQIAAQKGEQLTYASAARIVDEYWQRQYEALHGRVAAQQTNGKPKSSPAQNAQPRATGNTLTNEAGAEQARESAPLTAEQRRELAIAELEESMGR